MGVRIFSSHAEISLPSCFSDHMVLQQNDGSRRLNTSLIWGQADPGDRIQIEFNGKKYPRFPRKTPKSGQWEIPLSKLKPGGPYHLKITSRSSKKKLTTKTLSDVMVGDVWILGGRLDRGVPPNPSRKHVSAQSSGLRLFRSPGLTRDIHLSGGNQAGWVFPSGNPSEISRFSGVTYYFGLKLVEYSPGIPIGIIEIPLDRMEDYKGLRMVKIDPDSNLSPINDAADVAWTLAYRDYSHAKAAYEKEITEFQSQGRVVDKKPPTSPHRPVLLKQGIPDLPKGSKVLVNFRGLIW